MNRLELPISREHLEAGAILVQEPANAEAWKIALRQHHQERLARLFSRVGDSADERYLMDVMRRYRGIESP